MHLSMLLLLLLLLRLLLLICDFAIFTRINNFFLRLFANQSWCIDLWFGRRKHWLCATKADASLSLDCFVVHIALITMVIAVPSALLIGILLRFFPLEFLLVSSLLSLFFLLLVDCGLFVSVLFEDIFSF